MSLFLHIDQLLCVNAHVGSTSRSLNTKLRSFLIGIRKKWYIFDINISVIQYKLIMSLIIRLTLKRHKILTIRDFDSYDIREHLTFKSMFIWDKKWIGGALTNLKEVRFGEKFIKNKSINGLHLLKRVPSLICFFDINKSKYALREANYLGVPIVSLIDTDSKAFELVNYMIPSNNKGLSSIILYLNVIRNGLIRGRQKEIIKILNLTRTGQIRKWKKFIKRIDFWNFLKLKKDKLKLKMRQQYKIKLKRLWKKL